MSHLTLAFAGTPEFSVPALDAIAGLPHRLAGVFTQPDRPAGRGRELTASPVKRRALELGLPVFQPETFKGEAARELLAALHVDALIVVAYGLILPAAVLALPRLGCFNIHASLLPRWRGAAPIQRALLAGDTHTGVTIMRMAAGLDTGPMLASARIAIGAQDTSASLHAALAGLGARLMCDSLADIAAGRAHESEQPAEGVTYAAKIEKAEAEVNWQEDAAAIDRRVRAFNPRPVAQTHLEGTQLRLWMSSVLEPHGVHGEPGRVLAHGEAGIDVACGAGILRVTQVQSPGKTRCSAGEALRARHLGGARLTRTQPKLS